MKFGKYLEENHVPEWKDKYVQYKQIRKRIKKYKLEIENFRNEGDLADDQTPPTSVTPHSHQLKRTGTYANLIKRAPTTGSNTGIHSPFDSGSGGAGSGLQLDSVNSGDLQMAFVNSLAASAGVNKQKQLPLHSQRVLQRLIEIQGELTENIMTEAKKVNEFYTEREKEAIERFNQIYSQVHRLIQLRKEEDELVAQSPAAKESYTAVNTYSSNDNSRSNRDHSKSSGDDNTDISISIKSSSKKDGKRKLKLKNKLLGNNNINTDNENSDSDSNNRILINNNINKKNNNTPMKKLNSGGSSNTTTTTTSGNTSSSTLSPRMNTESILNQHLHRDNDNDVDDEEVAMATQVIILAEKASDQHHHDHDHLVDSNEEDDEYNDDEYDDDDDEYGNDEEDDNQHIIEMVPVVGENDGASSPSIIGSSLRKNVILGVFETIEQDMIQPLENKAKKWLKLGKKKTNESTMKELIQEFYRFLILVKNYKVLNYSGLVKIIKKAEKNTELVLNEKIIPSIDRMLFKTSKLIDKLSGSIEKIYADVFCNGKLRDARKNLRHKQNVEQIVQTSTTGTTFFSGMCAGWTTAILILIYFVLYTGEYDDFVRFSTVYNLFVTLGLTILWAFMFGINIYIWTKSHVHYSFIFELSRNTLTYHRVFQAVTVLSVLWITAIGIYMWRSIGQFPFPWVPAEFTPLILFFIYLLILICPFNIFQREIRVWFLMTIWRVVTAPAKTVKFSHFFMGDQLSSLVLMMVQLSQFICFYTIDAYHSESDAICQQKGRYINPVISALPATWRLLQCFRRYYDSKDMVHMRNALKYFLSIVVVFFSAIDSFYSKGWSSPTRIIWLVSGVINSSYSYWWDLFMDWSILVKPKTGSWNPFKYTLRKKRMYSPTFVYYIAIVTNFGFRATWSLTKSLPQLTKILPSYKLVVVIAIVEVLRRGQWNIYRLENEHINNCGRFRATRDIPLPYEIN